MSLNKKQFSIDSIHFVLQDDQSGLTSEGCPPGWLTSTDVRGCYWVSNHILGSLEAYDYCTQYKSVLVSILSEREDRFVKKLLHGLEINI